MSIRLDLGPLKNDTLELMQHKGQKERFFRSARVLYCAVTSAFCCDAIERLAKTWVKTCIENLATGPQERLFEQENADKFCNHITNGFIYLYFACMKSASEEPRLERLRSWLLGKFGHAPSGQDFFDICFSQLFKEALVSDMIEYTGELFGELAAHCTFDEDAEFNRCARIRKKEQASGKETAKLRETKGAMCAEEKYHTGRYVTALEFSRKRTRCGELNRRYAETLENLVEFLKGGALSKAAEAVRSVEVKGRRESRELVRQIALELHCPEKGISYLNVCDIILTGRTKGKKVELTRRQEEMCAEIRRCFKDFGWGKTTLLTYCKSDGKKRRDTERLEAERARREKEEAERAAELADLAKEYVSD